MADLHLDAYSTGAATVVVVSGELDLTTELRFEAQLLRALSDGPVVVDLAGVEFFAISTLASLVSCHRASLEAAVPLVIAAAPPAVRRLLHIAGLDAEIPLYPSVEVGCDAVRSLGGLRDPQLIASRMRVCPGRDVS